MPPKPPPAAQPLDPKEQAEIFKESYREALLFLKHQDDKINRVLTALAFLTAAGVALYIFSRPTGPGEFPTFANAHFTADDYFFASFLIGLFLSLAFALVALDPTSFTPRFLRPIADRSDSILFYRSIADRTKDEWEELFEEPKLREALAKSYHDDAMNLSNRAVHKVRRFGSANAVVQFTVATLALLGVMRLTNVEIDDRWWIATGVLIAYSVLPLIDFLYFRLLDFPGVGADYAVWHPFLVGGLFLVPFLAVSTTALVTAHDSWQPVTFTLFGTLVLRLIGTFEWQALGSWLVVGALAASLALTAFGGVWIWWFG